MHYIAGLREVLNQQELNDLKASLLGRARRVAEATGGLMGIGSKISAGTGYLKENGELLQFVNIYMNV